MELNVKLDYYEEEIEDVRKQLEKHPEVKLASNLVENSNSGVAQKKYSERRKLR